MPQLNVRVPQELKSALEERAYRERLSIQSLVERMLTAGLEQPLPGSMFERVVHLEDLVDGLTRGFDARVSRLEALAEGRY